MRHEFIHLSQNDPQWRNVFLGTSKTVTIGQSGCLVSSASALACYFGHSVTPLDINKMFIERGLFSDGDLISSDDDLTKVFSDVLFTTSLHYESVPANLQILKDLLSDSKTAVIIEIDLGLGSVHFTPVIDCDGTTVTIMNVWNGMEQNFKDVYGDPLTKILKFVVYHGNPISLDPLVCDRASVRDMIIGKATHYDEFVNAGYVAVGDVRTHIAALETLNKNLADQIASLKAQGITTFSVTGSPEQTVTGSTLTPLVPLEQAKQTSFWQTDIADLFKLFKKRGVTQ